MKNTVVPTRSAAVSSASLSQFHTKTRRFGGYDNTVFEGSEEEEAAMVGPSGPARSAM